MRLDSILTTVLAVSAVAMVTSTALIIRREFLAPKTARGAVEQKAIEIPHWQGYLDKGEHMGPAQAKVQLIEFADFECPFCGSFHKALKIIRGRYPDEVSLEYVHFPLPMHRFAMPAARVAECAGEQGRFEAMYDELFDGQESFGLKPWRDYATAAGVPDLAAFDACVKKNDAVPRIEEGKELGNILDVQGTPTLIINGWKLGRPPNDKELDGMVRAILAGKSPVTPDGKFAN